MSYNVTQHNPLSMGWSLLRSHSLDSQESVLTVPSDGVGEFSIQACDRCHSRKLKCNKALPSCQRCIDRNEECTYFRRLKKVPRRSRDLIDDRSNWGKLGRGKALSYVKGVTWINKNSDLEIKMVGKGGKSKNLVDQRNPQEVQNLIKDSNWHIRHHIQSLMEDKYIHGTSWENYFLTLLDRATNDIHLLLRSEAKYALSNVKKDKLAIHKKNVQEIHAGILELNQKALDNYFKFIHPYFTLFNPNTFHSRPRSNLLMMILYASGLRLMPKESRVDLLYEYYKAKILKLICPYKNKINLDYLQSLLCFYMGFRGEVEAESLNWLCCSFIINMAHMLGLHLIPPKKRGDIMCERALVYSLMCRNDAFVGVILGVPNMLSMCHASLFNNKLKKCLALNSYYYMIGFHCAQIDMLQHLRWLQVRIKNQIINSEQLIRSYHLLSLKFYKMFKLVRNQLKHDYQGIKEWLNYIEFDYHFAALYKFSLIIKYKQYLSAQLSQTMSSEFVNLYYEELKSHLDSIRVSYTLMTQNYLGLYHSDSVSMFSFAIINHIKYYPNKEEPRYKEIIQRGMAMVETISKVDYKRSRAEYYKGVFKLLGEIYGIAI